ncbi:sugar ABC transporter ATP-binding protein [Flindersiella endophytica]
MPTDSTAGVLLEMRDIVKQFPGVRALDGANLAVLAGEVHCLLGQNGAGKSTLIKVLAGAQRPDQGELIWQGEPIEPRNPTDAMRLGIATIYQELDLVEGLSVAENIFLGHEQSTAGFALRTRTNQAARDLLARLGHGEIPPTREVGRLSAAGQQIVSMARALSHDARLIVMDEPSAALAHDEVENLFRVIRDLTAAGVAVLYISHRLDEIRQIGDRLTILKDGRTAAEGLPAKTTSTSEIVSYMTGRTVEYAFPDRPPLSRLDGAEVVLRAEDLSLKGEFENVSFGVRAGEIVGLAGLVGSGRSEILETIYGARKPTTGRVYVQDRALRPGSVSAAVKAGIGLAPEERKSQALLMHEPIFSNITLSSLARYSAAGFLDRRREIADSGEQARALDLRPADPRRLIRTLSGGNQQKAVLARWLLKECRILLLDEPTRGVDVGARVELYQLIRRLADEGVSVVLVSSEVPEVLGLADRVLVVREGHLIHEADARDLDESQVLDLVMEGSAV